MLVDHERRHTRAALGPWHRDTVRDRLHDAGAGRERLCDLLRRDVLPVPAERIADAIDEIEISSVVLAHQVARAEPGVSSGENVSHYFALCGFGVGVAFERTASLGAAAVQPAKRLSDLIRGAWNAKSVVAAERHSQFNVEANKHYLRALRQKGRDPTERTRFAFTVVECETSFRRGVKLQNARYAEALFKGAPDIRPQSVAATESQAMGGLKRMRWASHQKPAQLSNILEQRAIPGDDLVPEPARREAGPQDDGSPADQHRAGRHDPADAVIHRQAIVHSVVGARIHHAGEPVAPLKDS